MHVVPSGRRFFLSLLGQAPVAGAQEWKSAYEKDGVQVSTRPVEGSKISEVRGIGVIESSAEQIFAVLGDVEAFPETMPPTESARVLRREGAAAWYYMVINPPIIARRDYCVKISLIRLPDGRARSEWSLTDEYCPAKKFPMVRIEANRGRWLLTPISPTRTHVVYESHADPAGDVPPWMVNRATSQSVPEIFNALRKAAAMPRYADCAATMLRSLNGGGSGFFSCRSRAH